MKNINRRNFLKKTPLIPLSFLIYSIPNNVFGQESKLEQAIEINLPSYRLKLINIKTEQTHQYPICIGKGAYGRPETPITKGVISDKRKEIIFRYTKNNPRFGIKKGAIIKWNNTFDENANPVRYRVPYNQMRGLGMKLEREKNNRWIKYYNNFVIHSTLDQHTIGIPSSNGCLRVKIEDMLELYSLVSPKTKNGFPNKPIPINIEYNIIEIENSEVIFHANIYHKQLNYQDEFKKALQKSKYNKNDFNVEKFQQFYKELQMQFHSTHKKILKIQSKNYPQNYVPNSLKEKLHSYHNLDDFI